MDTEAALDEFRARDTLGRVEDIEFIIHFMRRRLEERKQQHMSQSYVLNVDAPWGQGKTFFLEGLRLHLEDQGHIVALVNAWKDDHASDPLLALMTALEDAIEAKAPSKQAKERRRNLVASVKQHGGRVALAAAYGFGRTLVRRYVGDALDDVLENGMKEKGYDGLHAAAEASGDSAATIVDQFNDMSNARAREAIDDFRATRSSIEEFRSQFGALLRLLENDGVPMPLFVLIDELDRCRPPYAIATLERAKHLFDLKDVAFVVATNTAELKHSISAVYGADFGAAQYLHRFFDRRYTFAPPSIHQFVSNLLATAPIAEDRIAIPPDISLADFLVHCFGQYKLELRDIEQTYDLLRSVTTLWDEPVPLQYGALVPLAIGAHFNINPALHRDFVAHLQGVSHGVSRDVPSFGVLGEATTIQSLFSEFVGRASSSFDAIDEMLSKPGRMAGLKRWVLNNLYSEYAENNRGQNRGQPFSRVLTYPDLIRSAGRLTPAVVDTTA